ncbi:MAG: hypothetical protein U0514_04065 [Candidatus Andersenbacteria bacterium]
MAGVLLISLGVLIAAAGVIGHLPGSVSRSTLLITLVVGALLAMAGIWVQLVFP